MTQLWLATTFLYMVPHVIHLYFWLTLAKLWLHILWQPHLTYMWFSKVSKQPNIPWVLHRWGGTERDPTFKSLTSRTQILHVKWHNVWRVAVDKSLLKCKIFFLFFFFAATEIKHWKFISWVVFMAAVESGCINHRFACVNGLWTTYTNVFYTSVLLFLSLL